MYIYKYTYSGLYSPTGMYGPSTDSAYNVVPTRHLARPIGGNGDHGCMRQHKLDLVKALAPPPVLDGAGPTMARVTEAVDEDNGSRVPGRSGEEERLGTAHRHGSCFCCLRMREYLD